MTSFPIITLELNLMKQYLDEIVEKNETSYKSFQIILTIKIETQNE